MSIFSGKIKNKIKKGIATLCAVTLFAGVTPLWANENIGAAVEKGFEVLVEPTLVYDYVYGFYDGASWVRDDDGNYGVINLKGEEIVDCKYDSISVSDDGHYFYIYDYEQPFVGLMDTKGQVLIPFSERFDYIYKSYGNVYTAESQDKVAFYISDSTGLKQVLEVNNNVNGKERYAYMLTDDLIEVVEYWEEENEEFSDYTYYKIEGNTVKQVFTEWDYVRELGKPQADYYLADNEYILNRDYNLIWQIDPGDRAIYLGNNYLYVEDGENIRLLDISKKTTVEMEYYDDLIYLKDNLFLATKYEGDFEEDDEVNCSYMIIDNEGEVIAQFENDAEEMWLEPVGNYFIDYYCNDLYNYEGEFVASYEYIRFLDGTDNFIVMEDGEYLLLDGNLNKIKSIDNYETITMGNPMILATDGFGNTSYIGTDGNTLLTIENGNGYLTNASYARYYDEYKYKNCNGELNDGVIPVEFGDKWGIYKITSENAYISRDAIPGGNRCDRAKQKFEPDWQIINPDGKKIEYPNYKAQWTSYFGQNAGWYEGAIGELTSQTGNSFVAKMDMIGWGGVWGAQVRDDNIEAKKGKDYVIKFTMKSKDIDKWVFVSLTNSKGKTCFGDWIHLETGKEYKYEKIVRLGRDASRLNIAFGGEFGDRVGEEEIYQLIEGNIVPYDEDSAYATTIVCTDFCFGEVNLGGSEEETTTSEKETTTVVKETTTSVKETTTAAKEIKKAVKAPANTKISKLTAGKKKVKLTIKKVKKVKGYLIQYGTDSKFKKYKNKYIQNTTVTIKKLKSKKKYYFRVKAYVMNGKEKVLSKKWSKVKKVTVK
ncbi:MAG: hypothetical protein E7254_06650 [Lachnospiraceae bacterium]|nr:hypothetical protein [Lachnospiraceae bacterium]